MMKLSLHFNRQRVVTGLLAVVAGGLWYLLWTTFKFVNPTLFWISWLVLVLAITRHDLVINFLRKGNKLTLAIFAVILIATLALIGISRGITRKTKSTIPKVPC